MTLHGAELSPDGGQSRRGRIHGDEVNSLVDLYSKHERRIYRYCLALLRNPDDAEDATQETFTRAAPFLPNLAGDLSAYLTTVARNICCDVVRARSKRPVPLDNVALPDRAVSPERQSIDWDVVRRMWRQLTPSERLLFAYTFAGYRYEEIASRTGMSRPSVSVGLTRARRRLRDLATAIGALGLLPLGLRRLLDRVGRRANALLTTGQQALLDVAQQAGAVVAGLLAGLVSLGAAGTAVAAGLPAMAPAAYHDPEPLSPAGNRAAVPAPASKVAGAARTQSAPPSTGRAAQGPALAPVVVAQVASTLPGATATPTDVMPSGETPSPDFPHDGIVFMDGGVHGSGCPEGVCQALFRSDDAGASWTRLWPQTYSGGNVLLPPTFPADPTIFIVDAGAGVLSGAPGAAAPTLVIPGAESAAVDPGSPAGRAHLAAVTYHGLVETYTEGDSAPMPGPALPPGVIPTGIGFAGPGQVVVAGYTETTPGQQTAQQAVLIQCGLASTCGTPPAFAADTVLDLAEPTGGGPLLAYNRRRAYLSTDGGASYRLIDAAPAGQVLEAAGLGGTPTGTRVVVSHSDAATQSHTTAAYSDDLGATWSSATGDLPATGPTMDATVLSDGDLLLAVLAGPLERFALQESSGNGSWAYPRVS